jgi:hypothetical protein
LGEDPRRGKCIAYLFSAFLATYLILSNYAFKKIKYKKYAKILKRPKIFIPL